MAKALKIRVFDLLPELPAHAFVVLGPFQPAWAVATRSRQALLDCLDDLLVRIQRDFHGFHLLLLYYSTFPVLFLLPLQHFGGKKVELWRMIGGLNAAGGCSEGARQDLRGDRGKPVNHCPRRTKEV